ncbi:NADH-quinone oxidoreductase subunit C [Sulfurovum sp.]|uniref:NADH-quinone oxidoreductase subunit C n=1 Tax=Sulfurovum sp. TaxID=1969726 RepID=UPI0025EA965E|nr:NADH-quinone oxidoreductase subunit C [Sulfurovum sp.]
MRKYTPKDNVQKKSYYTDRYWVAPRVPQTEVEVGSHFADVVKALGRKAKESYVSVGQLVIHIKSTDNFDVMKTLKEECGYTQCSEQSAVDYLAQDGEFELFWQMLNITEAKRVRVVTRIKEKEAIESIEPLFKSANFAEREIFDMFGIKVNNHPFLKRILMPDDWEGHPLLKTYPLQGDEFASWYEVDKIFGKEYRDVIGPENRDPARIDRYDTKRFSRVGYEVPFGADISEGEKEQPIEYSETILVDYNKNSSKQLDERR